MSSALEEKILRHPKYKYIFRVGLNADYLVEYIVRSLKLLRDKYDTRRIFILNQDVAWAKSTASMVIKLYLQRDNWDILGQTSYPSMTVDFKKELKKASSLKADVILAVFDAPASGYLVEQWNAIQSPAFLVGFISPMTGPSAWQAFDGRIAGALNVVFEIGNLPSRRYPPSFLFYHNYMKRFGRFIESGHGPAPSYEAVHIFAEAVERAGSLDPDRVVDELERTDRRGVMGRIRFHRGHQAVFGQDPGQHAVGCLMQWTPDGHRKIVYPESLAEGEIAPPALSPLDRSVDQTTRFGIPPSNH
jgi:branched-chain amino acid transport system substrate-binding protein